MLGEKSHREAAAGSAGVGKAARPVPASVRCAGLCIDGFFKNQQPDPGVRQQRAAALSWAVSGETPACPGRPPDHGVLSQPTRLCVLGGGCPGPSPPALLPAELPTALRRGAGGVGVRSGIRVGRGGTGCVTPALSRDKHRSAQRLALLQGASRRWPRLEPTSAF